jgi:hypothetical protein
MVALSRFVIPSSPSLVTVAFVWGDCGSRGLLPHSQEAWSHKAVEV